MAGRFGSVITAMVTPFADNGSLDIDAAVSLARWLVGRGCDGLVLAGTTGESPTLSDDEAVELWRAVAASVAVPVIAGTGSNDTRHTVELTRRAGGCGVAGVLVVTPYYNRPSQAGLEGHFRAAASAAAESGLPLILYDIPFRTGRKIASDTLLRLGGDVPNIVAVKDAADDVAASARLIAAAPAGFELYSGTDAQTLPLLAVGAVGAVSVAAHWASELIAEMVTAFSKGDVDTAREINARLLASYEYESFDTAPNPIPSKVMLRLLGLAVGKGRPPMDVEPPEVLERARVVLGDLGMSTPDVGNPVRDVGNSVPGVGTSVPGG